MILHTARLTLRPWREEDAESLFTYAKDPDVGPIAGWPAHRSVEESLYVIRNVFSVPECYAICLEDDAPIGAISLKLNGHTDMTEQDDECELGYWLGKPFWGRGYMPEAAEELLRHGFEDLGMTTIWCGYYDGNQKSKRVQEKLGFKYHHTCDEVEVPLMNEVRIGHTNYMTAQMWQERGTEEKKDMLSKVFIDKKQALYLAERMSVPSHSDGVKFVTFERLNNIEEELQGTKYCHMVDGGIFRLYSQKPIEEISGKLLVISGHADCLQLNAVFQKKSKKHPKRMVGIFDNAITNAASVYLMKYFDLPENVVFAFTGDEEWEEETTKVLRKLGMEYKKTAGYLNEFICSEGLDADDELDMMGAYAVCKYLKAQKKKFNTIVLDNTYSGFEEKAQFSIENDFIYRRDKQWMDHIIQYAKATGLKWKFIPAGRGQKIERKKSYISSKRIIDMLQPENFCYVAGQIEFALDDETYEYNARGISCFSFCLPCDADDMHVEGGFGIRRKSYYHYIRVLSELCKIPV